MNSFKKCQKRLWEVLLDTLGVAAVVHCMVMLWLLVDTAARWVYVVLSGPSTLRLNFKYPDMIWRCWTTENTYQAFRQPHPLCCCYIVDNCHRLVQGEGSFSEMLLWRNNYSFIIYPQIFHSWWWALCLKDGGHDGLCDFELHCSLFIMQSVGWLSCDGRHILWSELINQITFTYSSNQFQ